MGIVGARPFAVHCAVALEPREGDLVVIRDALAPSSHTVVQFPDLRLATMAAEADAIAIARDFAQLRQVDVWYTDHDTRRLIDAFRPTARP
jgi:hypothetical protein